MGVSDSGGWELRRCPSPRCSTSTLRVRRDPSEEAVWWVGRLGYGGTWRIAATAPCCPLCGTDLDMGREVRGYVG